MRELCEKPNANVVVKLKNLIRQIVDFPKPGILFYDITTLLKNSAGFQLAINTLVEYYQDKQIDMIVGIEARGFIFAAALAYQLKVGLVPVRKPQKLPAELVKASYDLEYNQQQTLEMHKDAIAAGSRVLIIDDLLATGGTAVAVAQMVESLGGQIVGLGFLIELESLRGREKMSSYDIFSILQY